MSLEKFCDVRRNFSFSINCIYKTLTLNLDVADQHRFQIDSPRQSF